MRLSKVQKTLIFFLWGLLSFLGKGRAQNADELSSLASEQYKQGNYEQAEFYLERVIYFGDSVQKHAATLQLCDCYMASTNYAKAYNKLRDCSKTTKNDSFRIELLFKQITCLLLDNKVRSALLILSEYKDTSLFFQKKKLYFHGIAEYLCLNYDASQKYLEEYCTSFNPSKTDSVRNIFQNLHSRTRKTPDKARLLSALLPGAGQLYAGDAKNAINSFLLNASLLALSVEVGFNIGIVNSVLSFTPWLFRYYKGGILRAGLLVQKKNMDIHQKYYYQLIRVGL